MGKAFAGFIRLLITLTLLGVVGYNSWQIGQLRQEVNSLKASRSIAPTARTGVRHPAKTVAPMANTDGSPVQNLSAAQKHVEAARAALERKEYVEASREMTLAAEAAQKAGTDLHSEGTDRLTALKQAIGRLQTQADQLMDQGEANQPAHRTHR